MPYQVKNFERLLGTPGFSDLLLNNHFALYKGYVDNTNKYIQEFTAMMEEGKTSTPQYVEMKRRFGQGFNGMKLHEFYFGSMANGGGALDKGSALAQRMKIDFGSVESWEKAFRAIGAMRGVGWALMCYDAEEDSLYNVWINEHDRNYPALTTPILLMDVWEHAFMLDNGIKRDGYIDAFMKAVDWQTNESRFNLAAREMAGAGRSQGDRPSVASIKDVPLDCQNRKAILKGEEYAGTN